MLRVLLPRPLVSPLWVALFRCGLLPGLAGKRASKKHTFGLAVKGGYSPPFFAYKEKEVGGSTFEELIGGAKGGVRVSTTKKRSHGYLGEYSTNPLVRV